ncbi:hypothetical protein VNO80_33983 [Phaseolus coccineus]|uniref:Uncharacterized protein n=1 Tax=Phaseolus coccineus TaxID=3886 RepID=A0AAN9Q847_PHACN
MTRRSSISSLLRTRYRIELIVIDRSATSPAGKNQREKARREVAQRNRALSVRCHAFRLSSEDWPRLELTQKLAQKKHQKLHRHKPRQSLPSFEPGVRCNFTPFPWLELLYRGQEQQTLARSNMLFPSFLSSLHSRIEELKDQRESVELFCLLFSSSALSSSTAATDDSAGKAKKYDDSAAGRASSADERTLAKEQHLSKPLFIHLALPMLVRCQYSTLRRGPIAAEARASRSIISLWDILPRICGGMYTWSNSSRTKSSEPMLTADELTTAAEELVIAQIPSRSEVSSHRFVSSHSYSLYRYRARYALPAPLYHIDLSSSVFSSTEERCPLAVMGPKLLFAKASLAQIRSDSCKQLFFVQAQAKEFTQQSPRYLSFP